MNSIVIEEATRLKTLAEYGLMELGPDEVLDDLVKLASTLCQTPMALVSMIDDQWSRYRACAGIEPGETRRDVAFCTHTITAQSDALFVVTDARADARFKDNPFVLNDPPIVFYAGLALTMSNGSRVGALCVVDRVPRELTESQQQALATIAKMVVRHLEQRQEAAFRKAVLTSIGDAVIAADKQGRVTFMNPVAESMTGWKQSEALGQPLEAVFAIIGESSRRRVPNPVARVLSEGVTVGLANHTLLVRRDGTEVHIDDSAAPVRDDHGILRGAVLVFRDVDDKKRAESEREALLQRARDAQAAAERERQELRTILTQLPIAIAIHEEPRHTFTFVNPAYQQLVGGRDVLNRPLLDALPELAGQGFDVLLDEVMRTGAPHFGQAVPVKLAHRDEPLFVNFAYQPKRDAAGVVDGVLVSAMDLTEQTRVHQRVQALMAELKIADQRKDEFLAMLAHELRNPMAAISMALELMEPGVDPASSARFRDTARRQLGNLVRLVDDLLDVSRITRGSIELRREENDFGQVLNHALAAARPSIEARRQRLTLTTDAGPFPMHADAARLEQVVANLLTNASKYTDPGGAISVQLSTELAGAETMAVLSVKDTGRGIPKEMLTSVFELFVQVSPTIDRTLGGLGLGLTLVKRLVELHGGTVEARSAGVGRGAEFVVKLPLLRSPEAPLPVPLARATREPSRRIVVVEDMADARAMLEEFLTAKGHQVTTAANGLDGLARLLATTPEVALVDVGLPGIDGYEVARRTRADVRGRAIFLIALTGYGEQESKERAKAAGFNLHLTKPVDIAKLLQLLRDLPHAG